MNADLNDFHSFKKNICNRWDTLSRIGGFPPWRE
jgi:hypothetical protein